MSYLIKNKKQFILLAAFFAFACFLFFPGGIAQAANWIVDATFNNLLRVIRELVVMLLSMSQTLFVWIINVDNFNQIIANNGALYPIWQKVRDILNIAFILVLLFSAFSTIFQVEKYNYKKILLNLIIMALLVNFSFPITRFIIDASNVMMYTFVNNLLGNDAAGNALAAISDRSGMASILSSEGGDGGKTTYILTQIIFGFILAITLLAVGILLVIRMMALALIIIFSPIAFVGSILPDTSGKASQWWTYLFQYSFFGPIMIFVIYIATQFMQETGEFQKAFTSLATEQSIDPGMIGNMAMFSLPIVLLWMGMGVAQSMSIAGASTVMGSAQKFAGWAGKKFSGYNWANQQYKDYKKERDARHEEARFKPGKNLGNRANNLQDTLLAKMGSKRAQKRMDKRKTDKNKKDIEDDSKDLIDKGATVDTLARDMNTAFSGPPPTDKKEKVKQAAQAQAYLKQEGDDRKTYILNQLRRATGPNAAGTDLSGTLNSAYISDPKLTPAANAAKQLIYNRQQLEAQTAAEAVRTRGGGMPGYNPESDMRTVHSFINRQMKSKVETGANA